MIREMTIQALDQQAGRLCGNTLPISEFRRKSRAKNTRASECRQCRNLQERLRQHALRESVDRARLMRSLRRLTQIREASQICHFTSRLLAEFGGATLLAERICSLSGELQRERQNGAAASVHAAVLEMVRALRMG